MKSASHIARKRTVRRFVLSGALVVGAALLVLLATLFQSVNYKANTTRPAEEKSNQPEQGTLASGQRELTRSEPPKATEGTRDTAAGPDIAPVEERYMHSLDKYSLFQELRASGGKDAGAARYFAAKILEDCLDVSRSGVVSLKQTFLAAIATQEPSRAARTAAFERLKLPCAAFEGVQITRDEIESLYRDADEMGDVRAKARLVGKWNVQVPVPPDAVSQVVDIIRAGSPAALPEIGSFVNRLGDGLLINGEPISPYNKAAADTAWVLLACAKGWECGPDNPLVLSQCAYQGVCSVSSVPQLLQEVALTPQQYQIAYQYANFLGGAIQRGDYSSFGLEASRVSEMNNFSGDRKRRVR